jgi:hypothetical protein
MVVRRQLCLAFSEYAGQYDRGKADIVQVCIHYVPISVSDCSSLCLQSSPSETVQPQFVHSRNTTHSHRLQQRQLTVSKPDNHVTRVHCSQEVCTSMSQSPETIPVLLEMLMMLGEEADHVQEKYSGCSPEESHPLLVCPPLLSYESLSVTSTDICLVFVLASA